MINQCFVNYPTIPTPDKEILGEGTSRIQIRIDEGPFFIVRYHNTKGKEDRVFPLPSKPAGSPSWQHALSLPGSYEGERGIIFLVGQHWGFWSFDTESQRNWKTKAAIPNKHFLMAALETDPTPFDRFCRELLLIDDIFTKKLKKELPRNNWSSKFHTHWLEILMETDCSSNKESLESNTRILRSLKMDEKSTKNLIERLRRGAIVSMALRAISELPDAAQIIKNSTGKKPKDNTWMSLLELIKF
jgi:hypothetical protein